LVVRVACLLFLQFWWYAFRCLLRRLWLTLFITHQRAASGSFVCGRDLFVSDSRTAFAGRLCAPRDIILRFTRAGGYVLFNTLHFAHRAARRAGACLLPLVLWLTRHRARCCRRCLRACCRCRQPRTNARLDYLRDAVLRFLLFSVRGQTTCAEQYFFTACCRVRYLVYHRADFCICFLSNINAVSSRHFRARSLSAVVFVVFFFNTLLPLFTADYLPPRFRNAFGCRAFRALCLGRCLRAAVGFG